MIIKSTITRYSDDAIVIEVDYHDDLREGLNISSTLHLIDLKKETVTRFSEDLSIGFTEAVPIRSQPAHWEALSDRKNSKLTILEEVLLESGRNALKVKYSEESGNGSCTYLSEQYYLLYDIGLPPNTALLCGIPTHTFNLPDEYSHYRYIFRQWIEDQSEGSDNIQEHSTITTTIINQPTPKYSIEKLRSIPIVSKEEFHARVTKKE